MRTGRKVSIAFAAIAAVCAASAGILFAPGDHGATTSDDPGFDGRRAAAAASTASAHSDGQQLKPQAGPYGGARVGAFTGKSNRIGGAAARADDSGELLVTDPPAGFWEVATTQGLRLLRSRTLPNLGLSLHSVKLASGDDAGARAADLRNRFPGLLIDANHTYRAASDPAFPVSYAQSLIGWKNLPGDCGRGLRLGMIDARVDPDHPALAASQLTYRSFHRPGRDPGPADHGTAVAAILVGSPSSGRGWGGLVPGAHLIAANVFELNEQNTMIATAGALIEAVEWMAGSDATVINISLAGPDNRIVREVVEIVRDFGKILVAAAGNGGATAEPAFPAAYGDVIAVTAVEADRSIYEHANRGSYVEFAAPGVRVWTAVPDGGRFQSGTSFAAPYVSALAALSGTRQHHDLPWLRSELRRGVLDLGTPGRDDVYGWGLITKPPACVAAVDPA